MRLVILSEENIANKLFTLLSDAQKEFIKNLVK